MTIVEFLRERIAEDEVIAIGASVLPSEVERVGAPLGDWGWGGGPIDHDSDEMRRFSALFNDSRTGVEVLPYKISDGSAWDEDEQTGASYFLAEIPARAGHEVAQHIARWSPARVLAECKTKRKLVAHFGDMLDAGGAEGAAAEIVLGTLAEVYTDHPDYREEWRP